MDNGIVWPQLFAIDFEEMMRRDEGNLRRNNIDRYYSDQEIIDGLVVLKKKLAGYWTTEKSRNYPNPFYVKIAKEVWEKKGDFLFICESF